MADKHPKRPRDLNQWAKRMTDIVSGEGSRNDSPHASNAVCTSSPGTSKVMIDGLVEGTTSIFMTRNLSLKTEAPAAMLIAQDRALSGILFDPSGEAGPLTRACHADPVCP